MKKLVSYAAYPVLITWPVVMCLTALGSHRMPRVGLRGAIADAVLSAVVFIPVVTALLVLEKRLPWRADARVSRQDLRTDGIHLAAAWFVVTPVAQQTVRVLALVASGWFVSAGGSAIWPSHWPLLAQLVLALAVGEFGQYWFHRLAHETDLLWRVHATHHGTPQVYWLNSTRFHAFEVILKNAFQAGPLIVLGCGRDAFLVYGVFTAVHGWVQHSNVAYQTGFFDWIFATSRNHRWHHSTVTAEGNHNYGVVLALWDLIFGTFHSPIGRSFTGRIGIGDMPDFPKTYVGQFLSPFVWNDLARLPESRGATAITGETARAEATE